MKLLLLIVICGQRHPFPRSLNSKCGRQLPSPLTHSIDAFAEMTVKMLWNVDVKAAETRLWTAHCSSRFRARLVAPFHQCRDVKRRLLHYIEPWLLVEAPNLHATSSDCTECVQCTFCHSNAEHPKIMLRNCLCICEYQHCARCCWAPRRAVSEFGGVVGLSGTICRTQRQVAATNASKCPTEESAPSPE